MLRTASSRCGRDRKTNKDLGVADRKVVGTTSVLHPLHPLSYHLLGMPCQRKNTEGHISDRSANLARKYGSSAWTRERNNYSLKKHEQENHLGEQRIFPQ
ncbi:hypothetical protein NPIL_585281 [Nephila pilipes]|uniref:Uncharacterized protein n=1 Tax=Nephila pilipes TaxID=299642 RepID=A0A8X6UJH0_NEPPI|nr:hypothetical protein NPIL_585281 [Nephila pilipes]